MRDADYWIRQLKLIPHPEGGYYKETYRSKEIFDSKHLPEGFAGDRHISTSIYYLLKNDQCSKLHRIKSDEMWHYYDGDGLVIFSIDTNGNLAEHKLGLNIDKGESPQVLIQAGDWFGAKISMLGTFCLAGCTVSPGFHFDDFEMGDRRKLLELFPEHSDVICMLT